MNFYNNHSTILSATSVLNKLYNRCFSQDFNITEEAETFVILGTDSDVNLLQNPEYIEYITIMYKYPDRYELWGVCGSIMSNITKLTRKTLIDIINSILIDSNNPIILYVDFENPYWNRALGLYSSIGFSNPESIKFGEKTLMRMTYTNIIDKTVTRNIANQLRGEYYSSLGYIINKVVFKKEDLEYFREFAIRHSREYGGAIGIISNEFQNISELYVGNYIQYGNARVKVSDFYTIFHTHPDSTKIHVLTSPPSVTDLINMIKMSDTTCRQYIFESSGFYTIGVNIKVLPLLDENIIALIERRLEDIITKYFRYICDYIKIDYPLDSEYHKTVLISEYISEIHSINIRSLGVGKDTQYIINVEYNNYGNDYTDYILSDRKEYKGVNIEGLVFVNSNMQLLNNIMTELDNRARLEGCHAGEEYNIRDICDPTDRPQYPCTDRWDQVDLLDLLRKYPNPESLLQFINND